MALSVVYFQFTHCLGRPHYVQYVCIFGFKGASTSEVIGARNEMMMDDNDGQMIFVDLVGLNLTDIRLTGEENPEKTSPRKPVPSEDRTRARCVTSAHATTCSTAVDDHVTCWTSICIVYWRKLRLG